MPRDLLSPWDDLDWPSDPRLAFARGLAIGIEIGKDSYGESAAEAARNVMAIVDRGDARRAADAAGPREGDYDGIPRARGGCTSTGRRRSG